MTYANSDVDFDKYRLRSLVQRLIELDETEVHDRSVAIEGIEPDRRRPTHKVVLLSLCFGRSIR